MLQKSPFFDSGVCKINAHDMIWFNQLLRPRAPKFNVEAFEKSKGYKDERFFISRDLHSRGLCPTLRLGGKGGSL